MGTSKRYSLAAPRLEGRAWEDIAHAIQSWIERATAILDAITATTDLDLDGQDIVNVGGIAVSVKSVSGSVAATSSFIIATGAATITLPRANTAKGRELTVKSATASTVTVQPSSGDTIDGAASYPLYAIYESLTVFSDGTNWYVK